MTSFRESQRGCFALRLATRRLAPLALGAILVVTAAQSWGADAPNDVPYAGVAGVFQDPAPVRFYRSVTFYTDFGNKDLMADLSGGVGAPARAPRAVAYRSGLYGEALLAAKEPVVYKAAGNIDLSKPGALAVWISAYHWERPASPPWFPFIYVRDHGRTLSLARMGTAGNREAVYAYAGANRMVSVTAGHSLGWKTGQWHLLVVDWRAQSLEVSLDGHSWKQAGLVNTGFSLASGPPGTLRIGGGAAPSQQCLLDAVLVLNRPLTMGEVKWMYRTGIQRTH